MQGMIQLAAALVLLASNAAFAAPTLRVARWRPARRADRRAAGQGLAAAGKETPAPDRRGGRQGSRAARLRSESLDLRADGDAFVALVADQDRQQVLTLRVDASKGRLERLATLPLQAFSG